MRLTNKFSNNLMARHLLLTLGAERFGRAGDPRERGRAIADWSQERGLALSGMEIDNGSGLSRTTRISALQMAAVLRAAYHSRYAPEFIASLPLAGIDGTLRSRMQERAAGSVRLKTGHHRRGERGRGLRDGRVRQNLRRGVARQSMREVGGGAASRARGARGLDASRVVRRAAGQRRRESSRCSAAAALQVPEHGRSPLRSHTPKPR